MSKPTSLTYNSPTFKLGHHHEEQWLDASRTPFVKAKSLLKPYPEELMDAHDVSTNRQLSEVRWAGVHPTGFRGRYTSRRPVVPVVSNIKIKIT